MHAIAPISDNDSSWFNLHFLKHQNVQIFTDFLHFFARNFNGSIDVLPHCLSWLPSSQVNVDGLKRGADASTTISVQTLFTRTLRSLMFDNDAWSVVG